MRTRPFGLILSALLLAACTEHRAPTSAPEVAAGPPSISFAISDGAHGANGNPEFFFLPPLAGDPSGSPNFDAGKFAWHLRPVVLVYALPASWQAGAGPDKCVFTTPAVFKALGVVQPPVEQYAVNWKTPTDLGSGIYRVCVFSSSGGTLLGFLDVQAVQGGMKNARSGDTYIFQDGRTLPIKFRIESGALCPPTYTPDCVSASATLSSSAADTIVLPSGHGAIVIPPQTSPPAEPVTIEFTEEKPQFGDLCLPPSQLLQSQGCYHASATKAGGVAYTFNPAVTVEICVVPRDEFTAEQVAQLRLFKYNPTDGVQQWPWVQPTLIDCSGYSPLPPTIGGDLGGLLRGLGRFAQRIFAPQPLYAGLPPTGVGGSDKTFSDFGGALLSSIGVNGGNNETAIVGTPVSIPPSVIVRDAAGNPVNAVHVTFAVTSGGGSVISGEDIGDSVVATTGDNGIARLTSWILGPTAGTNTLSASAYEFVGSPVTFTATGTATGPVIVLTPTSVSLAAIGIVSPPAETVFVTNGGTGTLSGLGIGTVGYGPGASGWLTASVYPTTAPAILTLTAALGSLTPGTYTATVPVTSTASGVMNSPRNISVTFTVWPLPVIATDSLLPPAVVGTFYSLQLLGIGGDGEYHWLFSGEGSLPLGMSISASGLLSGTPTTAGNYRFFVSMQSFGFGVQKWLLLSVASAP